jgi:thiamine biosynthesis protein ThiS
MFITVNGKKEKLASALTLAKFIASKKLSGAAVALVNENIVKRANWKNVTLKNGDTVELIAFVGGG